MTAGLTRALVAGGQSRGPASFRVQCGPGKSRRICPRLPTTAVRLARHHHSVRPAFRCGRSPCETGMLQGRLSGLPPDARSQCGPGRVATSLATLAESTCITLQKDALGQAVHSMLRLREHGPLTPMTAAMRCCDPGATLSLPLMIFFVAFRATTDRLDSRHLTRRSHTRSPGLRPWSICWQEKQI